MYNALVFSSSSSSSLLLQQHLLSYLSLQGPQSPKAVTTNVSTSLLETKATDDVCTFFQKLAKKYQYVPLATGRLPIAFSFHHVVVANVLPLAVKALSVINAARRYH